MATEPSIPFNSYFDTQGQNNILDTLMKFKANRWQDAVGQGFQGLNAAIAGAQQRAKQKQQQQALAGIMAQLQQNPTGAQAGPQQPQNALPQGMAGPTMPPTSGMGAPQQPFNGIDPKQLIQALGPDAVQQMIQGKMTPPTPMNPLQQSQIQLNQEKANVLGRPSQPKLTNPLDDAIKRKRLQLMDRLLNKPSQTKTPPLSVFDKNFIAGLEKKVATNTPFTDAEVGYAKTKFGVDIKNVKSGWFGHNPSPSGLDKISATSPEAQGMSSEDLQAIAMQDDNQ